MKTNRFVLSLLVLCFCGVSGSVSMAQKVDPRFGPRKVDETLKGFVQDNLTIPVKSVNDAVVRIDNKAIAIDGYWEFKDEAGAVLREPVILSQPGDLTDRLVIALRAPGVSHVEITEEGTTKVYRIEVLTRYKENSIETELEAAIIEFVGDPGLKVKITPPQASLVGANVNRSFGAETGSEIMAPRGETAGTATGELLTANDFRPTIVLMGEVENELYADKALNIAHAYSPNIVNLMSIRNYLQMKIKVKIVRVDHTEDTNIGLQHRSGINQPVVNSAGDTGFGLGFSSSAPFFETVNGLPMFGDVLGAQPNLQTNVNLAKLTGKATLLQEPTLSVLNGESAEFNVGSLIPIQTRTIDPNTGTTEISTTFRQIGVILRILPLVREELAVRPDADGLIPFRYITPQESGVTREPGPERNQIVRTIDENGVMKMVVQPSIVGLLPGAVGAAPSFSTNFVETRVAMKSGQSLVIGGLFTDQVTKSLESIPFIEKIPIIGELFKNRINNKAKSELIFVLQPEVLGLKGYEKLETKDVRAMEDDIHSYDLRTSEMEKMLVDTGARKAKAKPVRISAATVTPRTVTLIEKAPEDFPPIQVDEGSTAGQSGSVSVRPVDDSSAAGGEPKIELAPEAPNPE